VTGRLVLPADAAALVVRRLQEDWASAVCAEVGGNAPFTTSVPLSPGITTGRAWVQVPGDERFGWQQAWAAIMAHDMSGTRVQRRRLVVEGVPTEVPATLVVTGSAAASTLAATCGVAGPRVDLPRAAALARAAIDAGALMAPSALRALVVLNDDDTCVALGAVTWLAAHPDLSRRTTRSFTIPGADAKWVDRHSPVLRLLTGRDVQSEAFQRPTVVHVTYIDPDYLASGRRRHDAWTSGDAHDLPYRPRAVLVVENRDCRLLFPAVPGAVVVEGSGAAAVTALQAVPWVREAQVVAYWGDLDAAGFAILDALRAALREPGPGGAPSVELRSLLMDARTLERHRHLGVLRDRHGVRLGPTSAPLARLTDDERDAYHQVATTGPAGVRRLEQERLPIAEAADALVGLVSAGRA